ncbi:MAG: response regulator [Synechococcales cyanobacterium H12SWP_bin.12]|nr:response regulator [Synechococcales cyanobacterium H12SWP_bin.12]
MKCVAIVDDDPRLRELIRDELIDEGYEAAVCSDGEELLELLDQREIDLILLDLMMPKMDGMTCLKRLNESLNDIPVLIVTAFNEERKRKEAKRLGAQDYILKPDLFDLLPELLERYL